MREGVLQARRRPERAGRTATAPCARARARWRSSLRRRRAGDPARHVHDGAALAPLRTSPAGSCRAGRNGAAANPASMPVTTLPGVSYRAATERREPRFVIPGGDGAVGAQPGALVDRVREGRSSPTPFRPCAELDADRLADRLRQQRRVERHRVGAVDAVAAGASRVDDADIVDRHRQQHRHAAARRVGGLRRRPHRHLPACTGDGARRAHRAVHLVRCSHVALTTVSAAASLSATSFELTNQRVARRLGPEVLAKSALGGRPGPAVQVAFRPPPPASPATASRRPRRRNSSDDDRHHARQAADRRLVGVHQGGAHLRRAHHRAVEHPGDANVLDELELAGGHRRHVEARDRRAQDCPRAGRSPRRPGIDGDVELLPGHELAVGDALRGIGGGGHDAGGNRELIHRNPQLHRGQAQQRLACGRARLCQVPLVEVGGRPAPDVVPWSGHTAVSR